MTKKNRRLKVDLSKLIRHSLLQLDIAYVDFKDVPRRTPFDKTF